MLPDDFYNNLKLHAQGANLERVRRQMILAFDEDIDHVEIDGIKCLVNELYESSVGLLAEQYDEIHRALSQFYMPLSLNASPNDKHKLYLLYSRSDEIRFQRHVNEIFWRSGIPLRVGSPSEALFTDFRTWLTHPFGTQPAIPLDGCSSRSIVLALSKVMSNINAFPKIHFKIGPTDIHCDPSPATRQRGNVKMSVTQLPGEHYSYDGPVYVSLHGITCNSDPARVARLANLLKAKSKRVASFAFNDFNQAGDIRLDSEMPYVPSVGGDDSELEEQIHFLNGLNFLRVIIEISRRLFRTSSGELDPNYNINGIKSDLVPVAILQAYSLDLLAGGYIDLKDVFGKSDNDWLLNYKPTDNAKYGVVTGTGSTQTPYIRDAKTRLINDTYQSCVLNPKLGLFSNRYSRLPGSDNYPIRHGRNYQRTILVKHYGGNDDSDGDDYSDDESYAP